MAPEIALGYSDVDGRADIYSLGCVAYYMLTGHHVFAGDTPLATALAHVHTAPMAPRVRSEFDVPPALDALIMECLEKDPAARPASAAVVSKRLATTVPVDAWTFDSARVWWDQHRPLTQIAAGIAGAATDDRTLTGVVRALSPVEAEALPAVNNG